MLLFDSDRLQGVVVHHNALLSEAFLAGGLMQGDKSPVGRPASRSNGVGKAE